MNASPNTALGGEAPLAPHADLWARQISQRMLDGDEGAFTEFYHAYCDRLFRYLLVMTRGDEETSRDLLQQSMIKAVRYWKKFEREQILWCWLTQICRTSFVDHLRKRKRRIGEEPIDLALEAAEARDESEIVEALKLALTELPGEDRELVERAYVDRSRRAELGEECKTSAKAVESRLARIRQKLRKLILEKLKDYALF